MTAIGGYFELENRSGAHLHSGALRLNTARNCFEYVLRVRGYRKVYIPYYTCDSMLEPLQKCGVAYEFYAIDEHLEPNTLPILQPDEAFLYTNYYGLKQRCVERLAVLYGTQLIVDNAQAFYAEPLDGIDTFYSPRKFVGVADGAYLYTTQRLSEELEQDRSYLRMSHLLMRADVGAEAGYQDFHQNEHLLSHAPIRRMSNLTEKMLCSVDYEAVRQQRRRNYQLLDAALGSSNRMRFPLDDDAVPMVYPFYAADMALRQRLIANKIFVATYWPNLSAWCQEDGWECQLMQRLLPLPLDQRYGEQDMKRIIEIIDRNDMQVTIRPLQESDALTSYKWRNDSEVFRYTGGGGIRKSSLPNAS